MQKIIALIVLLILVSGCTGNVTLNQNEDTSPKDTTTKTTTSTNTIKEEIKDCPYECCISDYKRKDCNSGYNCLNNKCVAIDTDGDGLSDVEEQSYGTSSTNADTDNDGLTDYVEVKQKGTNPTKANTDGDRYNDNEDSNPLVKNSAKVDVRIVNSVEEPNIINIVLISGVATVSIAATIATGGGAVAVIAALAPALSPFLDKEMYTYIVDVKIDNSGDDYSSYTNFDLVYKLSGTEVKRESVSLGKLEDDNFISKHFEHDIKMMDIPESLLVMLESEGAIESLLQMESQWTVSVEGVEYEEF